jgi:hypothetical protein
VSNGLSVSASECFKRLLLMNTHRSSTILLVLCTASLFLYSFARSQNPPPPDAYRHFIMPTGKVLQGGYLGVWELAFLQAGYGFADFLTVSGGMTIMPTVALKSQFAFLQAKATLADEGGIAFALGLNILSMTHQYTYTHGFVSGTAEMKDDSRYTALLFYKFAGKDDPIVTVLPYGDFSFRYGGALGAGLGFDTPLKGVKNTRVVVEIWNHDLSIANKIAALAAFRVEGERFSSDFGLMYFTLPLLAPVANFVWRFN